MKPSTAVQGLVEQLGAGLDLDEHVDLEQLLQSIVDEVTRQLEADRGTLYLVDHARGELVSRVAHLPELSEIRLRLGEGVAGWVARNGTMVNVRPGAEDPRFSDRIDQLTGYNTESLLAAPVHSSDGSVIAVLQILNKHGHEEFGKADEIRLLDLTLEVGQLLEATSLRSQLHPEHRQHLSFRFNHIVGESTAMREVVELTARAARTDATVLVRGESGSGKEAIARAVHFNSPRRDGPFVKVDCAALPEQLIENELFGHERGAFTSADRATDGKVQAADGGTLFLDEVGELSLAVQGKLLRLLQDRTFNKVGGTTATQVDVRFVGATHRDLESLVESGALRQDLYYRLCVVQIALPPIRQRGAADLDRLIDHFLFEFTRRHGRPSLLLSERARSMLHAHDWPGNVRELENCIESAVVLAPAQTIEDGHLRLGPGLTGKPRTETVSEDDGLFRTALLPLRQVECAYVRHVVERLGGNHTAAARALGIARNTLLRKIRERHE